MFVKETFVVQQNCKIFAFWGVFFFFFFFFFVNLKAKITIKIHLFDR